MRKVLFVLPSLDYGGAARQACLLANALPRDRFSTRVCVLGPSSPWAEGLRSAGLLVHVLNRRRPFDLRPFLELRAIVREPGLSHVHVWGAQALRAVVLSGARAPGQLLVSAGLPPGGQPSWFDRWLLRRAGRIVALGQADAQRHARLGVSSQRLTVLPRAVEPAQECVPAQHPGLPPTGRVVLGIGPMERHKGFREGVWAFDILAHVYPDLHFVIVGDGGEAGRVRDFARVIRVASRVHFVGRAADLAPWLARAEIVWVPSLREGGHNAVLEAMAAGKPVVASRLPGLAELMVEGQTGLLVTPDEKSELARQTHLLLGNAELRQRLGATGRQRAAELSVVRLAREATPLYEGA